MVMFTQLGELISVDFRPGWFPFDEQVIGTFFPNRMVLQSQDDKLWYGVTCTTQEWEEFMEFAQTAIRADQDLIGTTDALQLIEDFTARYAEFLSAMTKSPLKRPDEWARMVA